MTINKQINKKHKQQIKTYEINKHQYKSIKKTQKIYEHYENEQKSMTINASQ